MRTAILVAVDHSGKVHVLSGPDVSIDDQLVKFKSLIGERSDPKFAQIQLWTSDGGISKRHKFMTPDAFKAREEGNQKFQEQQEKAEAEKQVPTVPPAAPPTPPAKPTPTPAPAPPPKEKEEPEEAEEETEHESKHKKKGKW